MHLDLQSFEGPVGIGTDLPANNVASHTETRHISRWYSLDASYVKPLAYTQWIPYSCTMEEYRHYSIIQQPQHPASSNCNAYAGRQRRHRNRLAMPHHLKFLILDQVLVRLCVLNESIMEIKGSFISASATPTKTRLYTKQQDPRLLVHVFLTGNS